ncbi:MAG: MFS transporter [Thermoleophilaceae bacterium]
MSSSRRLLLPLVLATMATQANIVILSPIIIEVGSELEASVSAVGQGRSIMAAAAVLAALAIGQAIDRIGVRPLLIAGGALGAAGAIATGAAPSLLAFHLAHALVGLGVACLLSAGFAGVAAFFDERRAGSAMGYVVAAQSVAWIVGVPVIGVLTDAVSWRAAYAVPAAACLAALAAAALLLPRATHAAEPSGGGEPAGVLTVLRHGSARRWALAELVAYSAWTAELTYAGAFYVQSYGVEESAVGFLLAIGSVAFMLASLGTDRLTRRFERRRLIVLASLGMGLMLVPVLNLTPVVWFTLALFCVMAVFAGLRSAGASSLGLDQLRALPGSMMAARTASAQLGYMLGAVAGGVVLALADFGALGFVLFGAMAVAAGLIARVDDPLSRSEPAASGPGRAPEGTAATQAAS